jgi:hypothetical protein
MHGPSEQPRKTCHEEVSSNEQRLKREADDVVAGRHLSGVLIASFSHPLVNDEPVGLAALNH